MKKINIEGKVTMFQIVANHDQKITQVTQIATEQDLMLMWGVVFESDPKMYEFMKLIIKTYDQFKKDENFERLTNKN